nr:MAG TPA: hypothetical protein [Caudoviricetes sp.]
MTIALYNQDGVAATAQEVYDAYTSGVVLLHINGLYDLMTSLKWIDSTGKPSDETDVVGVRVYTCNVSNGITVGAMPEEAS